MTNFISGYSSGLREAVYVELNRMIQSEYRGLLYIQRLEDLAPANHKHHFHSSEKKERHGRIADLTRHYYANIGCYPLFDKVEFPVDYISGLEQSLDHALVSARNYSELLLSNRDPYMQRELYRAVNTEVRWATRVNFLYSSYLYSQNTHGTNLKQTQRQLPTKR